MTDIRKDFEMWRRMQRNYGEQYINDFAFKAFHAGYEAGRAHDIEGLIGKIKDNQKTIHASNSASYNKSALAWNDALKKSISIIRKHFGKE